MKFLDLILYLSLILFVLYITRINNMWGVSRGTKKAKVDVRLEKQTQKKRMRTLAFLRKMEWVANNIGITPNDYKQREMKHRLERIRWNIKILNRVIKPLELSGIMKFMMLLGGFAGLSGYILTGSVFFFVFAIFLFTPALFNVYADMRIADEDEKLERDFPDLFVILYSRLIKGTSTRLAPTLNDYIISLDNTTGEDTTVIKNFVMDLRNNIEIYGDDSIAVMQLREKYTSVMIVNFTNLAVQALRGVDNSDKLLAFKIELNQKRIEQMEKRADKLVNRGSKAVYLVYLILFQFILLSWYAKLSQAGSLQSIFG